MSKVGLVGVGNMGMGMAKNILKGGHALTAYDIRPEPLLELEGLGAHAARSAQEVGERSDYVFVMVLPCQLPVVKGHPWSGDVGHSHAGRVCHYD
jgi:3-hydroxyisobutyrate dehydrogenase-like beta-hydroxyacid dehydrogenase